MTTASPPGYSRLFATGLFLSTDLPSGPSGSRSVTPTPITTAPQTPLLEAAAIIGTYTGATTLAVPSFRTSAQRSPRRPKLAALRTHSARTSSTTGSGPPSAGGSSSVPASPRVARRRRSSITMSHNPMAAIKSPTRAAGMSGRTQSFLQTLGSPDRERRPRSLDAVGEQSVESVSAADLSETSGVGKSNTRPRRPVVARKPPPTAPLPAIPSQPLPSLPTLTLNTTFPSPNSLSPALTPSPGVLPLPTPGAFELGLHKFTFANVHRRPARSPLVTSMSTNATPVDPGYFDMTIRGSSPVLPENAMELE